MQQTTTEKNQGTDKASIAKRGVNPMLYLHPQTLSRLKTMELRAKMIVEGVMSGMHRSPYFGHSVEFAQHRQYVVGDDIRHMDWKVYARTDKLQIKQYEQETNLDLMVMVDSSGSMNYGSLPFEAFSGTEASKSPDGRLQWTKYDHATALAAALANVTLRQADRVGLGLYADDLRVLLKRSSAQRQWRQIVTTLAMHPIDVQTSLGNSVDQVLSRLNNKCIFAILSDFYMDPEEYRATLARIRHRGHDAMIFQIADRQERDFDLKERSPFVGLENEGRRMIDPKAIRKEYIEVFTKHMDQMAKITQSFGFDLMKLTTDEPLGGPLGAFLAKRNSRISMGKSG